MAVLEVKGQILLHQLMAAMGARERPDLHLHLRMGLLAFLLVVEEVEELAAEVAGDLAVVVMAPLLTGSQVHLIQAEEEVELLLALILEATAAPAS